MTGERLLKREADALLRAAVEARDIPGVVAVATDRDGTIYEGAFGSRVLGQEVPMTPDTVGLIASMTKAVTSTAAMQLVEEGKLDLDGPASRYVRELAEVRVLEGWDADGQPRTRTPRRPVTLRHLLSHTSGFGYEYFSADIGRYQKATKLPSINTCRNAALAAPLLADPGERWEYGISVDWVGKLVEAVTGERLGVYLNENVLGPLEMRSTGFKITPGMRARLSKVHQRGPDGRLAPTPAEIVQEPEFEMGGGGLYSTAEDYAAFVRMILNRGKSKGAQVLKPKTVDQMSQKAMGSLKVRMLKTAMPTIANDAELFPGIPKTWGLGFMINEETAPTGRSAGSLGWAGMTNSYYWIDPSKGVGGVYLTQIFPFADVKSLPLFYSFEKAVYQSLG